MTEVPGNQYIIGWVLTTFKYEAPLPKTLV